MHIVVTREDVAKHGLEAILTPDEDGARDATIKFDTLMDMLAMRKPEDVPAPADPMYSLWRDILRLQARAAAVLKDAKHGDPKKIEHAIASAATAICDVMANTMIDRAYEAEGLGDDEESATNEPTAAATAAA